MGSIEGVVQDQGGAVIPGASVAVRMSAPPRHARSTENTGFATL